MGMVSGLANRNGYQNVTAGRARLGRNLDYNLFIVEVGRWLHANMVSITYSRTADIIG